MARRRSSSPGDADAGESTDGVVWRVERDVLARTTTCVVESRSEYDAPYGSVVEHYARTRVGGRQDLRAASASPTCR